MPHPPVRATQGFRAMSPFRRAALWAVIAAGLGSSGTAMAAFVCYQVDKYPAVFELALSRGHLVATLGAKPGDRGQPDMQINRVLVEGDDGSWKTSAQLCTDSDCRYPDRIRATCAVGVPAPTLTKGEMQRLSPEMAGYLDDDSPDQKVGACAEQDGVVWFGITFYCGEGACGLGGIGRYDTKTHTLAVRRPKALLGASVSPVAFDGKYVWAGTFGSGECIGDDPEIGLVRYDWDSDTAITFGGGTDSGGDPGGPCGFRFDDLYIDKQGLWASSDMGIARLENPQAAPADMRWKNYVPTPADARNPLPETACRDLYTHLAATLPKGGGGDEYNSYYDQFTRVLGKFNPKLKAALLDKP